MHTDPDGYFRFDKSSLQVKAAFHSFLYTIKGQKNCITIILNYFSLMEWNDLFYKFFELIEKKHGLLLISLHEGSIAGYISK